VRAVLEGFFRRLITLADEALKAPPERSLAVFLATVGAEIARRRGLAHRLWGELAPGELITELEARTAAVLDTARTAAPVHESVTASDVAARYARCAASPRSMMPPWHRHLAFILAGFRAGPSASTTAPGVPGRRAATVAGGLARMTARWRCPAGAASPARVGCRSRQSARCPVRPHKRPSGGSVSWLAARRKTGKSRGRGSTRRSLTRPGVEFTCIGGKDHFAPDRETGEPDPADVSPASPGSPGCSASSWSTRFASSRARRASGSSSTSRTGCPPPTTPTRSPRRWRPSRGIVYATTTPMVLVHAPGAADHRAGAPPATSRPMSAIRTPSWAEPPAPWTSASRRPDHARHPRAAPRLRQAARAAAPVPGRLPSGSYLALCDGTDTSPALNEAIAVYNQNSASSYHLRSPEQIAGFFDA